MAALGNHSVPNAYDGGLHLEKAYKYLVYKELPSSKQSPLLGFDVRYSDFGIFGVFRTIYSTGTPIVQFGTERLL